MDCVVKRDDSDLRARGTGKTAERVKYSSRDNTKEARSDSLCGDIEAEDVHRRLRRPNHVLARCNKLNASFPEFGSLVYIAPAARFWLELTEVRIRYIINETAYVAPPLAPIVHPTHIWIYISSALLTSNNARRTKVNHVQRWFLVNIQSHGLAHNTSRKSRLGCHSRCWRQLAHCASHVARITSRRQINGSHRYRWRGGVLLRLCCETCLRSRLLPLGVRTHVRCRRESYNVRCGLLLRRGVRSRTRCQRTRGGSAK
mmetsp:Transcript_21898/g.70497  ORF Transcript_21898/g.70497 Transcript_21898/m.70497 type:complete len:258 (-) Transcript_21898:391-1164(-)